MGVSRADVDTVANALHALRQRLEKLSYSTFPGEDKEQQRFLAVVREWANVFWGVAGGISFRIDLTWDDAARRMTTMQASLHEVCAMRCSYRHYTESIHAIRRARRRDLRVAGGGGGRAGGGGVNEGGGHGESVGEGVSGVAGGEGGEGAGDESCCGSV